MTEFGRTHFETWLRIRAILFALAFLIALLIQQSFNESLTLLLILLAGNIALSMVGARIAARVGVANTVRGLLLLDVVMIVFILYRAGGISSGYAALYMPVVLSALLLLGQRAALQFAVLAIICFVAQSVLDALGIRSFQGDAPIFVEFIGQGALLVALVLFAVLLATQTPAWVANLMMQLREDKSEAEAERTQAEYAQQQWALVNAVALRIQEATTPDQVYATFGEELERVGLHCVILEWAQPGVSFRVGYVSLGKRTYELGQTAQLDIERLEVLLANAPTLAQAVATRKPEQVADVPAASAAFLTQLSPANVESLLKQIEAHNMIFVPMVNQDRVSGALVVWGKALGERDFAPLGALAQQVSSALDKARLLTEQRKRTMQLELVNNMATRLSSAENPEHLIEPLVQQVSEGFGYEAAAIAFVDEERRELHVAAGYTSLKNLRLVDVRQPLEAGIYGLVARTGEPYLARDTLSDPYFYSVTPETNPIRSEYVVPLRAGIGAGSKNRVIGVLDIESVHRDAFDASDVNALNLLAEQVSTALTKTRLLGLEQKRAAQLALVSEIAARAASFSNPDVIVRTMVELVQERFGYHHVCVSLYDAERNEMEQRAAAGPNAQLYPPGNRWDAKEGVIGLAARTRQTVYSGDLMSDPRYSPDPDKLAAMVTSRSALCVPLVSGRTVLGVLDVESEADHAFDANDIGAMETLANQMAAALEKARSLQGERRRAAQMALVNRIASRTARLMSTDVLMREAVQMIRAQFGYYNVAVLLNEQGSGVRPIANAGGLTPHIGTPPPATSAAASLIMWRNAGTRTCVRRRQTTRAMPRRFRRGRRTRWSRN